VQVSGSLDDGDGLLGHEERGCGADGVLSREFASAGRGAHGYNHSMQDA
jgi:hypothetical protein